MVVKASDLHYLPDKRVMLKVKHQRTADCVVAGFRTHKDGAGVGSMLLGLYDSKGTLHHVGVASGFSVARRRELVGELAPYRDGVLQGHPWAGWAEAQAQATSGGRAPGGMNRCKRGQGHDVGAVATRCGVLCEVSYDHLQSDRFRHATSFVRWRSDRDPASCTYSQLDAPVPMELSEGLRHDFTLTALTAPFTPSPVQTAVATPPATRRPFIGQWSPTPPPSRFASARSPTPSWPG